MKLFDIEIRVSPLSHDSDDFDVIDKKGVKIGGGFRSKNDGLFHIIRCPRCHSENYAVQVSQGDCAWCAFSLNKKV